MKKSHQPASASDASARAESTALQDRRINERSDAGGKVLIVIEGSGEAIRGDLVDMSTGGFRARFSGHGPSSGTDCRFEHPHGKGLARTVWSRIADGLSEAGFFVRPPK